MTVQEWMELCSAEFETVVYRFYHEPNGSVVAYAVWHGQDVAWYRESTGNQGYM